MKKPPQCLKHRSGYEWSGQPTDRRVPAYVSPHADSARLPGHAMHLLHYPLCDFFGSAFMAEDLGGTRTRVWHASQASP